MNNRKVASLDDLRKRIDIINKALLDDLKTRQDLVEEISLAKLKQGIEAHQPARFAQMMEKVRAAAEERKLDLRTVDAIFDVLHDSSIEKQRKEGVN